MAVPCAHLLRYKRGDELILLVEELVTLTPSIAELRRPVLAWWKGKALFCVANEMNNGHWIMKLIDVTIPDRIASGQSRDQGAQRTLNRNAHGPNENKISDGFRN